MEYDNIFEILTSDSKTANTLKDRSNEYIKLREAGQAIAKLASYTSSIHTPDDYASALELLELLSEDYESNVLLIDALTASIARFEQKIRL